MSPIFRVVQILEAITAVKQSPKLQQKEVRKRNIISVVARGVPDSRALSVCGRGRENRDCEN